MTAPAARRGRQAGTAEIEVQYAAARSGIPHAASLRTWARAALHSTRRAGRPSITLRIVGAAEGRKLNRQWRGKDKPTNVLSFPSGVMAMPGEDVVPLGDIVICAPVIRREAVEQGKASRAHWAHMVVHGVLHLLGYDHESGPDAAVMESLERRLLAAQGFPDPYGSEVAVRR